MQRAIRAQQPAAAMADMGFGDLCLVDSFPVSMSGDSSAPDVLYAMYEPLASSCPRLPGWSAALRMCRRNSNQMLQRQTLLAPCVCTSAENHIKT